MVITLESHNEGLRGEVQHGDRSVVQMQNTLAGKLCRMLLECWLWRAAAHQLKGLPHWTQTLLGKSPFCTAFFLFSPFFTKMTCLCGPPTRS